MPNVMRCGRTLSPTPRTGAGQACGDGARRAPTQRLPWRTVPCRCERIGWRRSTRPRPKRNWRRCALSEPRLSLRKHDLASADRPAPSPGSDHATTRASEEKEAGGEMSCVLFSFLSSLGRLVMERNMTILNARESSDFFDSLIDDREHSAVIAIHNAWLEHSSAFRRSETLNPDSPLDMLVLYKSAAATFSADVTDTHCRKTLADGGRVLNRSQEQTTLEAITDPEVLRLSLRFGNEVIALSETSAQYQDLEYYVDLFAMSMQDKRTINSILSGAMSRYSRRLSDPNTW